MRAAISRWEQEAAGLKGMHVIAQHKSFSYLFNWLGLVEAGTLEPKPGIEPHSTHLAQAKEQQVRLVVRTPFDSPRPGEWPAFAAGLIVLVTHVPLGVQVLARGNPAAMA